MHLGFYNGYISKMFLKEKTDECVGTVIREAKRKTMSD